MNNFIHATLTPEAVETLKGNLEILYGDLEKAVNEYVHCANNLLKHNSLVIKLVHGRGGITFPIEFSGQFVIPEIVVDWAGCDAEGITVRNADQMIAFKHLFVGRPLLGTLRPIVQELLSTDMGHFNDMAFLH